MSLVSISSIFWTMDGLEKRHCPCLSGACQEWEVCKESIRTLAQKRVDFKMLPSKWMKTW